MKFTFIVAGATSFSWLRPPYFYFRKAALSGKNRALRAGHMVRSGLYFQALKNTENADIQIINISIGL